MKKQKIIKGFTFIETLVAIFVFALVMGVVAGFIVLSYQTHSYAFEESAAVEEARRGMEIMIKEIRAAKTGDSGAYPIELADDKQFIFYSDIDNDGKTERVRYFLSVANSINSRSQVKECSTASAGGHCDVNFSNFFTGTLQSASLQVSVKGDFDNSNEYAAVSADGATLISNLCRYSCSHCPTNYEGATTFDVTSQASDNSIQLRADANSYVGHDCTVPNHHSMWAKFELNWTEIITAPGTELLKGVIEPTGNPVDYPSDQEKISLISYYVRNAPPIFEYFDSDGNKITSVPARLVDTKVMKVYLVVNVNPNSPPNEFELESFIQLRNLKAE